MNHCYVLLYPNSKKPVGRQWGENPLSWEQIQEELRANPRANVGKLLGPVSGSIDVEADSEQADAAYEKHLGHVRTPRWQATRGKHGEFLYDQRLGSLPAVVKVEALGGLEFRLGNGKQMQSVIPPSVVDGVERKWIIAPEHCDVSPLPEEIIQLLLNLPQAVKRKEALADLPELRNKKVNRVLNFCRNADLKVANVRDHDSYGTIIDLCQCPFREAEHTDGNPAFIVNNDGTLGFHCFHSHCADRTFADIEMAFGSFVPAIQVSTELEKTTAEAIHALSREGNIYQRGGVLSQIIYPAPVADQCCLEGGSPRLRVIPTAVLRKTLSACARWQKYDGRKEEFVRCVPPDNVVNAVAESDDYGEIPTINGIVCSPILRKDGTIAAKRGFDRGTGFFLDTNGNFSGLMPVQEAVAALDDVLHDFPFETPAHKAGWFAALATPLCRPAFGGRAPFFLIDANASRVGKGLLSDVWSMIFENRGASRYAMTKDQDELRKVITSVALSGALYLLFDNIKGKFGNATLENAMTAATWKDRVLGTNQTIELPLNLTWLGTANNATLTKDMTERTLHIRMLTKDERPSERTGFRYPNLLAHVKAHRNRLALASLSIQAHYIKAGRPDMGLPAWGAFEEWSALIRNSLVWAGLADPWETRHQLREDADEETNEQAELFLALEADFPTGTTVAEVLEKIEACAALRMAKVVAGLPGRDKNRELGGMLRRYKDTICQGKRLVAVTAGGGVKRWSIQKTQE